MALGVKAKAHHLGAEQRRGGHGPSAISTNLADFVTKKREPNCGYERKRVILQIAKATDYSVQWKYEAVVRKD